jgi:putative AlgH/UPF0301 family transcriptional regulator
MFHRIRAVETAFLLLAVWCVLRSQSGISSVCVAARWQWVEAFCAKPAMQATVFLPVQTKDTKSLSAGKLLVASRELGDPRFAETVILLVQYDAQGVVGLILNRRTDIPLSRVLEGLKAAKDRSDPVYLGGPVETPVVLALFQPPAKIEGAEHIFDGVYLLSAKSLFEKVISARPDPGIFHVYLGYAGWTKDQLRKEVELGAWFIFPPDAGTVFNSDPDSLWLEMIGKTELKLARRQATGAGAGAGTKTRASEFLEVRYKQ